MLAVRNSHSERVFNVTVTEAHCYYAGGVLVSNCDALQYLAIGEGEDRTALSGGQQRRVTLPFRSHSALGR